MVQPNLNGPSVGLELFDLGKLHDSATNILQTLSSKLRACDVLEEGAQVDTGVLLGVTVRCCKTLARVNISIETKTTYAKSG